MNVTEAKRRMLGEARKGSPTIRQSRRNDHENRVRRRDDAGHPMEGLELRPPMRPGILRRRQPHPQTSRPTPVHRPPVRPWDLGEKGRAHRRRAMAREEDRRDSQRIRTERRIHGGRIRQQPDTPLHGKHSLVHRPRKKRRGRPLLSAIPTQGERGQGKNARNPDPPCGLDQIPEHGTVPPIDPRLTTSNLQQQNRPGARG